MNQTMTIRIVIIKFALYFLGLMIVINILANIYNLRFKNIDIFITIFLLEYIVSKFIINNNRELTKQEYWQIFASALIVNIVYSLIGVFFLSHVLKITKDMLLVGLEIGLFAGVASVAIGLFWAKKTAQKSLKL